jgi:hypothetical protein
MIHYILRMFFPHLKRTQQLTLVRSEFCTLVWVFDLLKEVHLLMEGFSWYILAFLLRKVYN